MVGKLRVIPTKLKLPSILAEKTRSMSDKSSDPSKPVSSLIFPKLGPPDVNWIGPISALSPNENDPFVRKFDSELTWQSSSYLAMPKFSSIRKENPDLSRDASIDWLSPSKNTLPVILRNGEFAVSSCISGGPSPAALETTKTLPSWILSFRAPLAKTPLSAEIFIWTNIPNPNVSNNPCKASPGSKCSLPMVIPSGSATM